MKFISTRKNAIVNNVGDAILAGLAPDGGLFVPENIPLIALNKEYASLSKLSYPQLAEKILAPYFEGSDLTGLLPSLCEEAFNFPTPLVKIQDSLHLLELFHGPTCAFKDIGARFLGSVISHIPAKTNLKRLVLVATSGDTGGAVAAAFYNKKNIQVAVLYPKGKISLRQEKQLTCWGENIQAFSVNGRFDDCQKMVKEAFVSPEWHSQWELISANSISLGRLLPQTTYYAKASLELYPSTGHAVDFIVPTGNLGNGVAALWAKQMGFPIGQVVFATNANSTITDFYKSGEWSPKASVSTLANAMDVGSPSNFERMNHFFPEGINEIKKYTQSLLVNDDEIKKTISAVYKNSNYISCPHTATGFYAAEKLNLKNMVVVSTAHPAKFDDVVTPIIGKIIPVPEALNKLLNLPTHKTEISVSTQELLKNII
jgi:threonine synthase